MLRKINIRTRLLISFFIIAFFTLIVGVTGFISITSLGDSVAKTMKNVNILNDVYDHNIAIDVSLFNMLYISDKNLTQYILQTTKEHALEFRVQLDDYIKFQDQFNNVFTPGEMQDMANLLEMYDEVYVPAVDVIINLVENNKKEEAMAFYLNRFIPVYNTFIYYINNIGFMKNLRFSTVETEYTNNKALMNAYIMLFICLLSLIISVLLALAVTDSVITPLRNLKNAMEKIAFGNLDVYIEHSKSRDEIELLSFGLSEIIERLKQIQKLELEAIEARYEKDKAEASSKSKGEFLAKMSHEIRTPMNAIIGMTEIALREEMPDTVREHVSTIKHAGANLLTIINDILDISKIESGKLEITPSEYLFSSLMNDIISIIKVNIDESKIQFESNIDSGIPDALFGDENKIRQILLNILSNAVKYTEKGFISLTVSGEIIENKTRHKQCNLTVKIKDSGKGIKPEDIEKLFEDFVQINLSSNRGIEGTGLGLAIAQNLARAMGGDITVESEYGAGSTFTVTLPQKICDKQNIKLEQKYFDKQKNNEIRIFTSPEARILLVDDIDTNLKVAKGLLQPYQMKVDLCSSGQEAVNAVKTNDYDLVFMDHMMPKMDGVEAAGIIRKWEKEQNNFSRKQVPIIALTANAISGMREMFIQKGFNGFLAKPIDIYELDEVLNQWIPNEKKKTRGEKIKMSEENEKSLIPAIPGIDIKRGIANTGGKIKNYTEILSLYRNDLEERLRVLQAAPDAGNLKEFITHVHAIKSASASIGAAEVSAQALELENAGNKEDINFIAKTLPDFTTQLNTLIKNIDDSLTSLKNELAANDTPDSRIKTMLTELETVIKTKKAQDIDLVLEKLSRRPLDATLKTTLEKISDYVLMAEYEKALKTINEVIKT